MLPEPEFTKEDTQPNPALRRIRVPARLNAGWLAVAAVVTSATLVLTLILLFGSLNGLPESSGLHISLVDAGMAQTLTTSAQTVSDVLAEQGITLAPVDTIAPAPETPLSEGMQLIITRARPVLLSDGTQHQTVYTTFISPYDILHLANITLNPQDRIWIDGTETDAGHLLLWEVPPLEIVIRRAFTLTITDNGTDSTFTSAADTVGEALFDAGLTLYASDTVTPESGTPLTENMHVIITRGQPLTIDVDHDRIETRIQAATVDEALSQAGVALVGLDYVVPAGNSPVTPGMTIQVVRVTEETITDDEAIPFDTVYQANAEMELDSRATVQSGQAGIRRFSTLIRYEDGREIGREPAGDEIVRQPVNQVIAYGTKIVLRTVDTPDGPRDYWRKLRVYATSYHPKALGGDDSTALGMKLQKGMIGADPKLIPWETNLYVPDYGIGIMGDTGGARRSRYWIDLGYSDEDYVSWHRYTEIYLLTPVPDEFPLMLPEWAPPN